MIKQNPDGTFEVSPGEQISIRITKTQHPYLAQVSDPSCAKWDSVQRPNSLTEIWTFTDNDTVCNWCLVEAGFGFLKNDQGQYDPNDQYKVEIMDRSGNIVGHGIIPAAAGQSRPYRFHVSNL